MRLLVSSSIFLLVILIATDCVSAKKCGREDSCRKERSTAALEKTNHRDNRDCASKYNHDESRSKKRRSADEYQLERSNRKDSKANGDFEEAKDSRKKSRTTEKQKRGRSEEKYSGDKEETSKNYNTDKRKCKFEQKKSSESRREEKTCQKCLEDSSEYSDHSDEDVTPSHEASEEDSSASDDSE